MTYEPQDRAREPRRRQNGFVNALSELGDVIRHRGDYRCQQVVELVTDYLEHAMSAREQRRFERHLRKCAGCTRYVEQVRLTTDTLGRVHPEPPTDDVRNALVQTFKDFHRD